jgi:amino acid adenylation domain-containing protein
MGNTAPELIPLISDEARARLRRLLRERLGVRGDWHALSHGQNALWFLWKLAPENCAYNVVLPVGVRGGLDTGALKRALRTLSDRHPALRTEFKEEGGATRQRARARADVPIALIDAAGWSDAQVQAAVQEQARRPFDLAADAALRVTLIERGPAEHVLLLAIHHIVGDLWSFIVLMDELRTAYAAAQSDELADLPPLATGYPDFVRWQLGMIEDGTGEAHWDYWREELAGDLPVLDLPTDRARPPMQSFRGGTVTVQIDADLTRSLKQLAAREGATLFMALLAAFQILLHRYSGQDDVIVGAPASGRNRGEFAGVFGDFVNLVPLRADFAGNPSFHQALAQTPFSLLVDRLQAARDLSRSPIFQASFVLQQFHRFPELSRALLPTDAEQSIPFAGLTLDPWPLDQQDGQFDVNLEMKEDERGCLIGAWKFAADLFDAATVAQMAGHFEMLLREIVAEPARPVGELRLLTAAQTDHAVTGARGPALALPAANSAYELFEAQVARRGTATAVVCGDASLNYADLAHKVDDMARRLAGLGMGPDVVAAMLLPRGMDFIAALLATSKAGGAFLPLDPRHPLARTAQIVASKPDIVKALGGIAPHLRPRVIAIKELAQLSAVGTMKPTRPNGLAYMMYTSGSTGAPKGVMVEHRGMINHLLGKLADLGMGEDDALAQNAPQSFDVVVWQSLAPLVNGGRVVVVDDDTAENTASLLAEIERRGVTVLQLVPSMLRALIEDVSSRAPSPSLDTLRWMVPTGEALPAELCRRWLALYPHIPLLNTYGSTECSDDQCHYRLGRFAGRNEVAPIVSIGTPIQNMAAYVLDRNLAPVPDNVVGELYIGGIGVGRGYRGDTARTAAGFVPDPFSERAGARLYKTRDLARRRPDGTIDFLGRVDHMIKLRGLRIEPGEIEAALCRHPAIAAAAVAARDHPSGERRLVAYIVRAGEPPACSVASRAEIDELRRALAGQLPLYMVPAAFCFVEALPLSANGKLDLRRLPAPDWQAGPASAFVAPRTPAEEKLAGIWASVLGEAQVSVTADFFAIGGDSILSIQIAARCRAAGLQLQPRDLFQHRTIAALIEALTDQAHRPPETGGVAPAPAPLPALSADQLKRAIGQVMFDEGSMPRP